MSKKNRAKQRNLAKGKQESIAAVTDVPQASAIPTVTSGVHGQSLVHGYIQTREKNAELIGRQRYITYSEMIVNSTIVGNGVRYFLALVGKSDWRAEPADDSEEAQRFADLTMEILNDMKTPLKDAVEGAAMFRHYGFSVLEWTMKLRPDGNMGFKDLARRAQNTIERWDVEDDGTIIAAVQRSPQTYKEIKLMRSRLVYLVDKALDDSPEGLGLFRHLVDPVKRLNKYLQLEGWGYENDLRGIPIIRAPLLALARAVTSGEITQAQADAILNPLKDMANVHARNPEMGLMIDSQTWQSADEAAKPSGTPQFDVSLLDGGNYSLEEVADAIIRINQEIARLLGIEHLLLGADGVGSLALAKDKSDNFALTVDGTLGKIREAMQRDLLGPLWEINGWPEEMKPKLMHEQVTNRDINRIAEALTSLSKVGIVMSRNDAATTGFMKLIGLPGFKELKEVDPELAAQIETKAGTLLSEDSKANAAAQVESAQVNSDGAGDSEPPPTTN